MKIVSMNLPKFEPENESMLIHAIQTEFGFQMLDKPQMSHDIQCPRCGGNKGYMPLINPKKGIERMWFCSKPICLSRSTSNQPFPEYEIEIKEKTRAIEWSEFCEKNGIGNLNHMVRFESIEQSNAKIEYLSKFANKPVGLILMQGTPGSGKTYAAMATCELFTRTNYSAVFITQDKMIEKWLNTFKFDECNGFKKKCEEVDLLIIDDFGLTEPPPGFLKFFMDVINSRLQWDNRGTIITTNLSDENLSKFCGDSLIDRINMGQKFIFTGKSRRKPIVL